MHDSIPILSVRGVLLASIQTELRDAVADEFQKDVLTRIAATRASGMVIDISAMELVDSYVAQVLAKTSKMAALMGTRTVLVGMRPEVAATLIRMGFQLDIETALDLDDGLSLLERTPRH